MSEIPDVSIIVAAFNAEQFIAGALASALSQTHVSLEVIVADDASTDETVAVVEGMHDARVRLVKLSVNSGPGGARNAAIDLARGKWIAVLDADDWMEPGRLEKLIALARDTGADIVADNLWVEVAGARSLLVQELLDDSSVAIDLVEYARTNRPTKAGHGLGFLKPVFSSQFLKRHGLRYDPDLRIGEDFILVAEMLARGAVYLRQRSAAYIYRKHSQSISHRLGAAEAEAMVTADERFIAEQGPQASPALMSALNSHLTSAKDAAAFARLLDAIKRRRWADAALECLRRPIVVAMLREPLRVRLERLYKAGVIRRQPRSA